MDKLRTLDNLVINKEIDEVALSGNLQCFCGCEEFNIYHTGKQTNGIIRPNIAKYKGQVIIYAKCINCDKTIKILDSNIDGIKPKVREQQQTKQLIIKNNVKTFKINLYYNYNNEDYKTNKFMEVYIEVENKELKNKKIIY